MSLLAVLVVAAASARVESVYLTKVDERLAVRVNVTGTPGMVAVHREGDVARVSIMDVELGLRFAGGQRFSWTPTVGFAPELLAATPARLERLEIAATPSEVSLLLHVPPEASVQARRDARGILVLFRPASEPVEPQRVAVAPPTPRAEAPAPAPTPAPAPVEAAPASVTSAPPPAPAPAPEPVVPPSGQAEAAAPPAAAPEPAVAASSGPTTTPPPPSAAAGNDTAELARRLFPVGAAEGTETAAGAPVSDLYSKLFPSGAPQTAPETVAPAASLEFAAPEEGIAAGPFRIRAGVDARYVDADTFIENSADKVRDHYLEVVPRVAAVTPVGQGRLTLEYNPVLRAFATYDQVNSNSQLMGAQLELPVGPSVTLRAHDQFVDGVLDTRAADPGGEYFFGLGRFHRNDIDGGASILVGPRLSVELGGAAGAVRFVEESSFFSYDTREASGGLGFELTPSLKAIASYVYDTVPTPPDRPEAESTSHSARVALTGEIAPLLTGEVNVAYRSQKNPNAGEGGTSYSGLTMAGMLTRQFTRDATASFYVSRSTPVSAFEENGFYVATGLQGALQLPLPAAFQLRGGVGYQWNNYRTDAIEIGAPREDRILGWFVGLRRPVRPQLVLAGVFRREVRNSNLDQFDSDANGVFLQLEWDIFGTPHR